MEFSAFSAFTFKYQLATDKNQISKSGIMNEKQLTMSACARLSKAKDKTLYFRESPRNKTRSKQI